MGLFTISRALACRFFIVQRGIYVRWEPVLGARQLSIPHAQRYHTDDSAMVKYHDSPTSLISKAAASLTFDAGCEDGGGVACGGQYFIGFMAYNRLWFEHDHYGLTVGGGAIRNPGRYLVLIPPINGATAANPPPAQYFSKSGRRFSSVGYASDTD